MSIKNAMNNRIIHMPWIIACNDVGVLPKLKNPSSEKTHAKEISAAARGKKNTATPTTKIPNPVKIFTSSSL